MKTSMREFRDRRACMTTFGVAFRYHIPTFGDSSNETALKSSTLSLHGDVWNTYSYQVNRMKVMSRHQTLTALCQTPSVSASFSETMPKATLFAD